MVGSGVALLYLATYSLVRVWLKYPPVVSSALALVTAVVFQYLAHSIYTFRRPANDRFQIARFVVTVLASFAISTLFLGWAAPMLGIAELPALALTTLTLPVVSYVVFLLWVFAERRGS
jgi:putative flippase GtrA